MNRASWQRTARAVGRSKAHGRGMRYSPAATRADFGAVKLVELVQLRISLAGDIAARSVVVKQADGAELALETPAGRELADELALDTDHEAPVESRGARGARTTAAADGCGEARRTALHAAVSGTHDEEHSV